MTPTTGKSRADNLKDVSIQEKITWTSNVKYFFIFLMIMTRYGSLIPATIKIFYKWELVLQLKITNLMKELLILSMYSYAYGNKTESEKLSYLSWFSPANYHDIT